MQRLSRLSSEVSKTAGVANPSPTMATNTVSVKRLTVKPNSDVLLNTELMVPYEQYNGFSRLLQPFKESRRFRARLGVFR
ncbi:hypothetical protein VFPFJ_09647 [Purpureocillium lilacinum]|uniref:Uncharacterized protein n=1 Tax=Purpureocillium lilacinum TaxID=33203 RepID=A0A179GCM8_PURLI|nr:hypothetical protein VFPFJ_09647 [Purpureocillium lilacinum]OAQ75566.1 hypothetical protein VFPBJ_09539 [Purpureocillium lilacinum]OAQ81192.1 hypothetical protein VFPFJ_09647 [Purpureocillium lilacinum]